MELAFAVAAALGKRYFTHLSQKRPAVGFLWKFHLTIV
jgi:hypothetical protein